MIEKEFVPYEEALALKELEFNEPCFGYWGLNEDSNVILETRSVSQNGDLAKKSCNAPTFSQAFRFFRKMGLDQKIERESEGLYIGFYWNGVVWEQAGTGSYEEAEFACLRELIEIVKSRG
jgi:hypothetical protein